MESNRPQELALEGIGADRQRRSPKRGWRERWTVSPDGLSALATRVTAGCHLPQREPATAEAIRDIVAKDLPEYVGPRLMTAADPSTDARELEFLLKRRSRFLLEGLDLLIQQRGETPIGTGPFLVGSRTASEVEMRASSTYYGGKPFIDRIIFRSYDSVRSAWADMLRGRVDMLYEVGVDALDALRESTQARTFAFQRPYAFLVALNVRNSKLRDKGLRRALNDAIDRPALIADAMDNHGTPADGPVWPHHWSYSSELPRFTFHPTRVTHGNGVLQLRCLILRDQAHERIVLAIQRQLRSVESN